MKKLRLLSTLLVVLLPLFCLAQTPAGGVFDARVGKENRIAEQVLSSTVPKGSDPIHSTFGQIFKSAGMTGSLPEIYTPIAARAFELPTILIPVDKADILLEGADELARDITYLKIGEKVYCRHFVHPLEAEKWKKAFEGSPKDPVKWLATPTSSSRSLFVTDTEGKIAPFVAKTSLNYTLAGGNRRVSRIRAERAVMFNSLYRDMMERTKGVIPNTNKTWSYFSESLAAGAKEFENEFTIIRTLPKDYREVIYLPFFALISERGADPRWIDLLYKNSGYTDKLDFVWNEIAKPMLEFESMIHMDNGLVTELHQQNAMLKIDPRTNKIVGFAVRDMDGQSADYVARKHLLGLRTLKGGLTEERSSVYGYLYGKLSPMLGYEYMKDSLFKHVFSFFLSSDEVARVVGGGNQFMLERFNQKFAGLIGRTRHFLSITDSYYRLYDMKMTPEEKAIFDRQEAKEKESTSFWYRLASKAQFKYYELKQRFEKTKPGPEARPAVVASVSEARIDRRTQEVLAQIANEASGLVPKEALDHWLAIQTYGLTQIDTELPLLPTSEKILKAMLEKVDGRVHFDLESRIRNVLQSRRLSTAEMRSIALQFNHGVELKLRAEGRTSKSSQDFWDLYEQVSKLYISTNPFWYTFDKLSPTAFVGLMAIPINVVAIVDSIHFVDGYELPPIEFQFHEEIHALGITAADDKEMKRGEIRQGSVEYYQEILARVRFTKHFVRWAETLKDPLEKRIVKTLWFDAFHEVLPNQLPTGRGFFVNYAVTPENLSKYIRQYLTSDGRLRLLEKLRIRYPFLDRLRLTYGSTTLGRFTPGDFLAPTSRDADKFTVERVVDAYRKLDQFATQMQTQSARQNLRSSELKERAGTCRELFVLSLSR